MNKWCLTYLLLLWGMAGYATPPANLHFSPQVIPETPLLEMRQGWLHQGRALTVPFQLQVAEPQALDYAFTLPPNPADTLWLYIPGMIGLAEIRLNALYLGISLESMQAWYLPVPLTWFETENTLRLWLHPVAQQALSPVAQIGLVAAPMLIDPCEAPNLQLPLLSTVASADSVAVLAACYPEGKLGFDPFWAARSLLILKQKGIRHVYFPFEPGRRFRALCVRMGLKEVRQLTSETQVAWINAYLFEPAKMKGTPGFWIDINGDATAHYGLWQSWGNNEELPFLPSESWWLALLILAPLLGLFLIKWILPSFWAAQRVLLRKPQLFLEGSSEGGYSQPGALFFLMLARWLSVWAFGSLLLYALVRAFGLATLIAWGGDTLLTEYLAWADTLPVLVGTNALILLGWLLIKGALLLAMSGIFRIKNLWSASLIVDVVGSYPLVFFLPIGSALLLYSDVGQVPWFLGLLGLMWGVYFLRRMYVIYTGLGRLFSFSYGMKFLYICTLNLMPYIIWL